MIAVPATLVAVYKDETKEVMMRTIGAAAVVLATVLACLPAGSAVQAGSVLGEWRLIEQTYGEGKSNLIKDDAPPVRIEFFRRGPEIQARIRAGGKDADRLAWPRFVSDLARGVHVEEQRFSSTEDRVRVRYRVDPSPGDDLVLVVTEEYAVAEEGRALVGTVRVEFRRGGEERGSYLLHRRFVKEP